MRRVISISLVLCAVLFGLPYLWRYTALSANVLYPDELRLYLEDEDKVITISIEDYLIGCLYAQIPISFHEEALKAQAVAAHTYALRLLRNNALYPENKNDDYDISDSTVSCQPFYTEEKAKDFYGSEYFEYYETIRESARYGKNHVITYSGQPIYAVYHSVSAGTTNSAYGVWERDFPYLQPVNSSWDKEYIDFICTNELTTEEMRARLLKFNRGIQMPIDYSLWFSDIVSDEGGYVREIKTGNTILSGGTLWRLFNLRSTAFEIKYNGLNFTITTTGHGHGVGLSQYGANYMAKAGYSAEEILCYYYTGVEIN